MTSRKKAKPQGQTPAEKHSTPAKKRNYRRHCTRAELENVENRSSNGLEAQMELIQVLIRRVFDAAGDEATLLGDHINALNSISAAAGRLARIMAANTKLSGGNSEESIIQKILDEALTEIGNEIEKAD